MYPSMRFMTSEIEIFSLKIFSSNLVFLLQLFYWLISILLNIEYFYVKFLPCGQYMLICGCGFDNMDQIFFSSIRYDLWRWVEMKVWDRMLSINQAAIKSVIYIYGRLDLTSYKSYELWQIDSDEEWDNAQYTTYLYSGK